MREAEEIRVMWSLQWEIISGPSSAKGRSITTVGQEAKSVENYLFLQNLRFGGRIRIWVGHPGGDRGLPGNGN